MKKKKLSQLVGCPVDNCTLDFEAFKMPIKTTPYGVYVLEGYAYYHDLQLELVDDEEGYYNTLPVVEQAEELSKKINSSNKKIIFYREMLNKANALFSEFQDSDIPETIEEGKQLSDLLGKPVYRIFPYKNGDRSYMDYYSAFVLPFKKIEGSVLVLTASKYDDAGLRLETLKDTSGWEDFTPIHKATMEMTKALKLAYSFDAAAKYESYLQIAEDMILNINKKEL